MGQGGFLAGIDRPWFMDARRVCADDWPAPTTSEGWNTVLVLGAERCVRDRIALSLFPARSVCRLVMIPQVLVRRPHEAGSLRWRDKNSSAETRPQRSAALQSTFGSARSPAGPVARQRPLREAEAGPRVKHVRDCRNTRRLLELELERLPLLRQWKVRMVEFASASMRHLINPP